MKTIARTTEFVQRLRLPSGFYSYKVKHKNKLLEVEGMGHVPQCPIAGDVDVTELSMGWIIIFIIILNDIYIAQVRKGHKCARATNAG